MATCKKTPTEFQLTKKQRAQMERLKKELLLRRKLREQFKDTEILIDDSQEIFCDDGYRIFETIGEDL